MQQIRCMTFLRHKLLPSGMDVFRAMLHSLKHSPIAERYLCHHFTLGSDGQCRIDARAIAYDGVRNIVRIFKDTPVPIGLMATIGMNEQLSIWSQRIEVKESLCFRRIVTIWEHRKIVLYTASKSPFFWSGT